MNEHVINEWLQKGSNAFLDTANLIVNQMGDELFFLIVAMFAFWCINKRFGFKLINVYLIGTVANTALKNIFKRPRPYTLDSVRSIGEQTGGYSFPSGHSHSIANLSTQVSLRYKKLKVILPCVIITLLVMFTRVYLGQHYLTDVLVGACLGVITAIVFSYLFELLKNREHLIAFVVVPVCVIALIVMAILEVDTKSLYDVCGGYAGVTLGYALEKKYVGFNPKANLWQNAVKLGVGAVIVLAIKEGLKALLKAVGITHPIIYSALRYFLVAFTALFLVPMLFKALKLQKKE